MDERYSRQQLFSPIGEAGQKKLNESSVTIVGAGALGASAAEMLVRAGIGTVTIADRDYVEYSNLQRQQLYTEKDAAEQMPKAAAAEKRLREINSGVHVHGEVVDVDFTWIEAKAAETDLIIDGTDNFDTRLLINEAARKYGKPWVYGACVGSIGMVHPFLPGERPCFRCVWKKIPSQGQTCDTVGVIAPAVQSVAAKQTAAALKILVGDGESLPVALDYFDLWNQQQFSIGLQSSKDPGCESCGEKATYPALTYEHSNKTSVLCGRDTVQIRPGKSRQLNFERLERDWESRNWRVRKNPYLLSVQTGTRRIVLFQDGRALIHGTSDVQEAKRWYAQLLG
ncbi:ThiF family adenylyltransferase [Marinococcus halotolerans]|uniref:ThiF family adenylyltransferase n=1 Tax=Marinococcus halotolerans TaxID=301092 RepID=UPI0003B6AADB|nr:ThiF family adenylyltransferase [Marinococcus halotolerans]